MAVKDRANDPKRVPKIKVEGAAGPKAKKFNGGKNREKFIADVQTGKVDKIGAGGTWTTQPSDLYSVPRSETGYVGKVTRRGSAANG
jgi:hypothetical protein